MKGREPMRQHLCFCMERARTVYKLVALDTTSL